MLAAGSGLLPTVLCSFMPYVKNLNKFNGSFISLLLDNNMPAVLYPWIYFYVKSTHIRSSNASRSFLSILSLWNLALTSPPLCRKYAISDLPLFSQRSFFTAMVLTMRQCVLIISWVYIISCTSPPLPTASNSIIFVFVA